MSDLTPELMAEITEHLRATNGATCRLPSVAM